MDPIYIKLSSSIVAGLMALALCKAYDMFYNLEYTKTEYIKAFVAGFLLGFISLVAFEFITAKTVIQLGGSVSDIKIPGNSASLSDNKFMGGSHFKYNTGMPNF